MFAEANNNFSPHENYLYSDKGCIIDLDMFSDIPKFPKIMDVTCKGKNGVYNVHTTERVTRFISGHISWR